MDLTADNSGMTEQIGQGASVAALARSIAGLGDMLRSANEQRLHLANNLLAVKVQETLADASVGTKIDTQA